MGSLLGSDAAPAAPPDAAAELRAKLAQLSSMDQTTSSAQPTIASDVPLTGYAGVLLHPDGRGYSTELNAGVIHPELNQGRPTNIPLLVPGQPETEALLSLKEGEQLTPEQRARAEHAAIAFALARQRQGAVYPSFDTWDDAETYALTRHDALVHDINRNLAMGPNGFPIATPTVFDREGNDLRRLIPWLR
jgi:hypothetical protein